MDIKLVSENTTTSDDIQITLTTDTTTFSDVPPTIHYDPLNHLLEIKDFGSPKMENIRKIVDRFSVGINIQKLNLAGNLLICCECWSFE
jgi:hypothetical protein